MFCNDEFPFAVVHILYSPVLTAIKTSAFFDQLLTLHMRCHSNVLLGVLVNKFILLTSI